MRPYMSNEYIKHLIGKTLLTNDSELKKYNGLKVIEIIKELTEKEYDRELIDDSDKNEQGKYRYLINTMYKIRLENNETIQVFEDEINPDYKGSWEQSEIKKEGENIMKLFDYSELIRVIDNVEIREEQERKMALTNLKERYKELEKTLIKSGILDDWNRLKKLCSKANIRLCVSHQGKSSIGCVINHKEDFKYCQEYRDEGIFSKCMDSGSHWSDYYGFIYTTEKELVWKITHTTNTHWFEGFAVEKIEEKYQTRIQLLETFKNTYEDYRNFQLKKIEEKFKSRIKPEDIKGCDKIDLSTFVRIGDNRKDAYIAHIEFEMGFENPNLRNIITFKDFCKELDLGYSNSNYIQIARLYEDKQGIIWYDNEYTH